MHDDTRRAMRLWSLAQPAVSAFITSVVRDFTDRDDILQEVAVAVLESFASYDEGRPFTPWAIGVARNQIGLHLRRRRRDRHTFDTAAMAAVADACGGITAEEMRHLDHLEECVGRLDPRSRRLCELRYRDDLKPAAIAQVMAMSANTVSKALQRIRDQLRSCIERRATTAAG